MATYLERETAKQEALSARQLREAKASWAHLLQVGGAKRLRGGNYMIDDLPHALMSLCENRACMLNLSRQYFFI